MNFLQALYERSHYKCFFRKAPFKTALSISYRDYKKLNFRIMKQKIDAYSIFIKVLSEKS